MRFEILKKIRYNFGEIYKFQNYSIYLIPIEKLSYGISPIIDKLLNKEIDITDHCRTDKGRSINSKYASSLLKKKDITIFIVTKTIDKEEEIWFNEALNDTLILKVTKLNLLENDKFFNMIRKQLNLRPIIKLLLSKNPEKYRLETISSLKKNIEASKNQQTGGYFKKKITKQENIISFMFIEKKTSIEYYINLVCTTKLFHFDPIKRPEYNFPWGTFLLFILLKSFGTKKINLYNDASRKDVIHYHKRFLFNLGNKRCHLEDLIYNTSSDIDYNIIHGYNSINKEKLNELIKSLPSNYRTNSGYRMKICDIQNTVNLAKINEIEKYLELKWSQTFNIDNLSIKKVIIDMPKHKLSLLNSKKNNKTNSKLKKKSKTKLN